jgi:hypothetical protein
MMDFSSQGGFPRLNIEFDRLGRQLSLKFCLAIRPGIFNAQIPKALHGVTSGERLPNNDEVSVRKAGAPALRIVVLRAFTESLKEMTDCQRLCRRMS